MVPLPSRRQTKLVETIRAHKINSVVKQPTLLKEATPLNVTTLELTLALKTQDIQDRFKYVLSVLLEKPLEFVKDNALIKMNSFAVLHLPMELLNFSTSLPQTPALETSFAL